MYNPPFDRIQFDFVITAEHGLTFGQAQNLDESDLSQLARRMTLDRYDVESRAIVFFVVLDQLLLPHHYRQTPLHYPLIHYQYHQSVGHQSTVVHILFVFELHSVVSTGYICVIIIHN